MLDYHRTDLFSYQSLGKEIIWKFSLKHSTFRHYEMDLFISCWSVKKWRGTWVPAGYGEPYIGAKIAISWSLFQGDAIKHQTSIAETNSTTAEWIQNKKVLLHERKRHTARRIASTRYASGGGGLPHPVMVGGDPIQSWLGGYPIQSWWGVPHPVMVGVPHPVMVGGTLGTPSRPGQGGYHGSGVPPTIHTWDGVPPTHRPETGYPPPTSVDRLKILPSLILRMRAVIKLKTWCFLAYSEYRKHVFIRFNAMNVSVTESTAAICL